MLARGKVTPAAVQAQLFADRNFMGNVIAARPAGGLYRQPTGQP